MKTDDKQSQNKPIPLGQALKDARLAASLSLEDIAGQLNLSVSTVRDLEDNLDEILEVGKYPIIYLRGYLCNYAKLLGLTKIELFIEYKQLASIQKQHKILRTPSLSLPSSKKRSKKFVFLMLLIVIACGAFCGYQKLFLNNVGGGFSFTDSLLHSSDAQTTKLLISDIGQQSESLSTVQEVDTTQDSTSENNVINEEASIDSTQKQEPGSQVNVDETVIALPVTGQIESEDETKISSLAEELILSFSADCWTEVFDSTGERIAFGLYKEGRVLSLSGVAPFTLKLGDPSVVEIEYQEQTIDADFTPGQTKQFSIPLA